MLTSLWRARVYITTLGLNVFTVGLQFLSLIVATQTLSVAEVGSFLSLSSTSVIAFCLIGFGSGELLTAEIARSLNNATRYLNQALLSTSVSFVLIVIPVSWIESLLISIDLRTCIIFNVNMLLCSRLVSIAENLQVALGQAARAGVIRFFYATLQLSAFLALFGIVPQMRFEALAWLNLATGLLAAAASIIWLVRPYLTSWDMPDRTSWAESFQYMAGQLLGATTANIDRVLATAMLPGETWAMYVMASRTVQIASMPVTIFFRTVYHRFFSVTEKEDKSVEAAFLKEVLLRSTWVGVGTAILASFCFWIATYVILQDYAEAAPLFCIMSFGMPFISVYYTYANQMNAHRKMWLRNRLDVVAVVLMLLCFVAVYSVRTAITMAIALLVSRIAIAVVAFLLRVTRESTSG